MGTALLTRGGGRKIGHFRRKFTPRHSLKELKGGFAPAAHWPALRARPGPYNIGVVKYLNFEIYIYICGLIFNTQFSSYVSQIYVSHNLHNIRMLYPNYFIKIIIFNSYIPRGGFPSGDPRSALII